MATRGQGKIRSEAKFTCAHPKTIKDKEDASKRTQVQFFHFSKSYKHKTTMQYQKSLIDTKSKQACVHLKYLA
jgi:hypothetical protein